MPISPHDVSVVVQGPVMGKRDDPPALRLTAACLESVRKHLPGAEVILSTWRGTDTAGLDCDQVVLSDDPGPLTYAAGTQHANLNRMIVSTRNGLAVAGRRYALKTRTDIAFTGPQILRWGAKYPSDRTGPRVFTSRIVVPTAFSVCPRRGIEPRLYTLNDWLHFGEREDVASLWACPLARERPPGGPPEGFPTPPGELDLTRFNNEQYLWMHRLANSPARVTLARPDEVTAPALRLFEEFVATNLVLVSPRELGIRHLKYRQWPTPSLSSYTHGEWRELYRANCDPNHFCPVDFESMVRTVAATCYRLSGGWLRGVASAVFRLVAARRQRPSSRP